MTMYNPPHPGGFIQEIDIKPFTTSFRLVLEKLNVASSTFNRLVRGQRKVTPEMVLRFSKTLGRSPESWFSMQEHYDLW